MSKSLPVFHLAAKSGLIAASTSADTVLFVFRNPSPTVAMFLHRLEVKGLSTTGFSTAFENALEARDVTSFDGANYTGGTDLSDPSSSPAFRRINVDGQLSPKATSVLASGNVRIASTTGMSHAGAPVISAHPFAWGGQWDLVSGSTVPKNLFTLGWEQVVVNREYVPRLIRPGEGFVIRNPQALQAAGALRMAVSMLWSEKG